MALAPRAASAVDDDALLRAVADHARRGHTNLTMEQRRLGLFKALGHRGALSRSAYQHVLGRIDVDRLRSAVRALVREQAVFRSAFVEVGAVPLRMVDDDGDHVAPAAVTVVDGVAKDGLVGAALREHERPFDPAELPLLRVAIMASQRECVVVLTAHQPVVPSDAELYRTWCRLVELYRSSGASCATDGGHRPQAHAHSEERCEVHQAALDPSSLPLDRHRQPNEAPTTAHLTRTVLHDASEPAASRLVTSALLLIRTYCGDDDVAVAVRSENGHVGMVTAGMHDDLPLTDAVEAVAHSAAEAERCSCCYAGVLGRSAPGVALPAVVEVHRMDGADRLPGAVAPPEFLAACDGCNVSLRFRVSGGATVLDIAYDATVLDHRTVEAMAECLETVVRRVLGPPAGSVGSVDVVSERLRSLLVTHWARGDVVPSATEGLLHELIETSVDRWPDRVAVASANEGVELTYAEFERAANQLAHHLRVHGVQPGALVAICLGHSHRFLVAAVAALKCGASYLPLDHELPEERLLYVLRDSGAALVLTSGDLDAIPADAGHLVLEYDDLTVARHPASRLAVPRTGDDIAYVIYTSGSTGGSKGVAVRHRGLVNYLRWATDSFAVDAGTGALVHTNLSFDLTVTSLFAPLLVGRSVTFVPEGLGVAALSGALRRQGGFSFVKLTPTHLSALQRWRPPDRPGEAARVFVVGGEALTYDRVSPWLEHAAAPVVVNEYGPTEITVACTAFVAEAGEDTFDSVPIGRPIWNTTVYVLDRRGQPVPPGVPGEIYVGGAGVAARYVNRPSETASRFMHNPCVAGEVVYRTGDLGRFRGDGVLLFLGRRDDQVKVRGHRVELGEVEAALLSHPGVGQAVVVADPGTEHLMAYAVLDDQATDSGVLADHLARTLPPYMVPKQIVIVDRLPIGRSGKVDRRAFRAAPGNGNDAAPPTPVGPREAAITSSLAWATGRELGPHDDVVPGISDQALYAACSMVMLETGRSVSMADVVRHLTASPVMGPAEARPLGLGERLLRPAPCAKPGCSELEDAFGAVTGAGSGDRGALGGEGA